MSSTEIKLNAGGLIFCRKFNDLTGGRFDPFFHEPSFAILEGKLLKDKRYIPLRTMGKLFRGVVYSRGDERTEGHKILRANNIDVVTGELLLDDLVYIREDIVLPDSLLLKKEDILICAASGSKEHAGKVCFIESDLNAYLGGFMMVLRCNDPKVYAEYLAYYMQTNLFRKTIFRHLGGTNINNLSLSLVYGLRVIVPSKPTQERAISLMRSVREVCREKIKEATSLLGEIDTVLLGELGIKLKPELSNTIEERIFHRSLSQVTGNRFDAPANWKQLSFKDTSFPLVKFRDYVEINPITRFPKSDSSALVTFVPMEAVSDKFGEIIDCQTRQVAECGGYTTFQEGDVIWAKITPCMENGKSALAMNLKQGVGFGSTEFHVFRVKSDKIKNAYLHYLLRLQLVRTHARLFFSGSAGHQRVDQQFFERLKIPLPSPDVQIQIVNKVSEIQIKARNLFREAENELLRTKQDIEDLILRNGA